MNQVCGDIDINFDFDIDVDQLANSILMQQKAAGSAAEPLQIPPTGAGVIDAVDLEPIDDIDFDQIVSNLSQTVLHPNPASEEQRVSRESVGYSFSLRRGRPAGIRV